MSKYLQEVKDEVKNFMEEISKYEVISNLNEMGDLVFFTAKKINEDKLPYLAFVEEVTLLSIDGEKPLTIEPYHYNYRFVIKDKKALSLYNQLVEMIKEEQASTSNKE